MRFQDPETLDALWRETGLREVETAPLDVAVEYEGFDDFWLPFGNGVGPAAGIPPRSARKHRRRFGASASAASASRPARSR